MAPGGPFSKAPFAGLPLPFHRGLSLKSNTELPLSLFQFPSLRVIQELSPKEEGSLENRHSGIPLEQRQTSGLDKGSPRGIGPGKEQAHE